MGSHVVTIDSAGRAVVTLSGSFGLGDASNLAHALVEALEHSSKDIVLSLGMVEQFGVIFFQMLFALCKQAKSEGKRVVVTHSIPNKMLLDAEQIGITQKDFETCIHVVVS